VTVCLSVFIPINYLAILSSIAIAGGLYFFFAGFRLLARKRLLLTTPTSKIRSAALGLVEVNGVADGPYTISAPITGKPCFLYHTTAWEQRARKRKEEWEKVADETLHLPFFIDDSTGRLLIEPLGADLDLHRDFREEYAETFFCSNLDEIPPRISAFVSRHGILPGRRLRIEERSIKPDDPIFVAGTLTENPGIQVRPPSPLNVHDNDALTNHVQTDDVPSNHPRADSPPISPPNHLSQQPPAPQIIRLAAGASASGSQHMGQQAKIVAALTRAGIARPEAWSAAGVPYQSVAVKDPCFESPRNNPRPQEELSASSGFDLTPPVVLMKGSNHPMFVISFRSQKELLSALGWKSAAMAWGGAAITLLGLYMLLARMGLL